MTTEQKAIATIIKAVRAAQAYLDSHIEYLEQSGKSVAEDTLEVHLQLRTALAQADRLKPTWSVNEVAGLRGKSAGAIAYWCRQGWIPAEREGGTGPWRIYGTRQELLAFEPPKSGPKAGKGE